jgi:hypothetical protein
MRICKGKWLSAQLQVLPFGSFPYSQAGIVEIVIPCGEFIEFVDPLQLQAEGIGK